MASPSQLNHVYLSFDDWDVRNNILSHLNYKLKWRGLLTFVASEEQRQVKRISEELTNAIEESRIAVILFSKNFAFSALCLDEVVKIMECQKTNSLSVLPVFYKVEPREVRGGRKEYKDAFIRHEREYAEDLEVVEEWKEALRKAGNLSGWSFNVGVIVESTEGTLIQSGSREFKDEAELVKSIVEETSIQLKRMPLDVGMHPVGTDSRVKELVLLLNMESRDGALDKCIIIGLWAMGGMGKTILAKTLYNSIFRKFEGSAFLEGINKTSKNSTYTVSLQENLLYQLLMTEEKVNSVSAGINLIKNKLRWKKVLIVLDGVDSIYQIEDLVGRNGWFGDGSRVIITTRNQIVLRTMRAHIYEVTALERTNAVKLFEKYIFGDRSKKIERCLAEKALKYTQGLPLALKVLGSAFDASSDWESHLDEFAISCHQEININLRKSYDELDAIKKDIFLDIACFFDGWSRIYVEGVLGSCYHRAAENVDDLIKRSLIRDEKGTLKVHVLIEWMGKHIVEQECHKNPERLSRIWRHGELADVLSRDEGRNATVKAIVLDLKDPEEIHIGPDGFKNLKMLRFLIMINVDTNFQGTICLPNELRWFEWHECRASGIKFTSTPKKLAILGVRKSIFKELGKP